MPVLAPDDLRVTFQCRDCWDTGYVLYRCQVGDGPQTRDFELPRRRCDRGHDHGTHTYAVRCVCKTVTPPYPPAPPADVQQPKRERWRR